MSQSNGNDPHANVTLDEPTLSEEEQVPKPTLVTRLFATRNRPKKQELPQNKVILIAAGAVVVVLLLFLFSAAPARKHVPAKGSLSAAKQSVETPPQGDSADEQKSIFPIVESTRPPAAPSGNSRLGELDLEHMAKRQPLSSKIPSQPKTPEAGTLASIPPFDTQGAWQAPPYQPGATPPSGTTEAPRPEREQLASLVFVQKTDKSVAPEVRGYNGPDVSSMLGLPIGTRLRARLESAVSTAVKTPAVAVIEYNYEKNGEIVVPAGTRVFGRIEQADRMGYMSLKFDSLLLPDGSRVPVEAVATSLSLGPLRGKVEGKNTGKNVLVRSLSGIGEVGALLVGRTGGINQPFSEGDLIRERIGSNIGESADQEVTRLAFNERVVVSVFANTPIYVVLEQTSKEFSPPPSASHSVSSGTDNTTESLRQLLQLQRELNQGAETTPH